jgi:hypothetical protein
MKLKIAIATVVVSGLLALAVAVNPLLLMIPFALTGKYGGLRSDSTLEEAHARAVNSFVESKGFGLSRMRHLSLWNDRMVYFDGREYDPWRIQLIALSSEMGERIYTSTEPPKKNKITEAPRRDLSFEERTAVAELRKGMSLSSPIAMDSGSQVDVDGAMRVLAPLRLTTSCIECHKGKVGDLIGAFAYTLVPQYQPEAEQKSTDSNPD